MKIRKIILFFLSCLIFVVAIKQSFALLPLLVAEFAETVVESFVIRSVAKDVITTVGTAASDSSWVSTFTTWLNAGRALGSIVAQANVAGVSETIEVAISPSGTLTKGNLTTGYIPTSPINSSFSIDGVTHYVPSPNYLASTDVNLAGANYVAWWNSLVQPAYQWTLSSCTVYSSTFDCDVQYPNGNWTSCGCGNIGNIEQKDGIRRVLHSGSSFSADASDPDWTSSELNTYKGLPAIRFHETATLSNLDVYPTANSVGLKFQNQVDASNVRELNVLLNSSYIPMAIDSSLSQGYLDAAPQSDSSLASSSPIVFPTDYARTGEAVSAAQLISPKLDTLHHDLSDTTSVDDPTEVDPSTMPSFGDTFDNLKSWNLPSHSSICPAPDIDLSGVLGAGHVYHFNAHCQLMQDHFAALQAAMMVCWSLMALFIVLRA